MAKGKTHVLLPWHHAGGIGHWTLFVARMREKQLLGADSLVQGRWGVPLPGQSLRALRRAMRQVEEALAPVGETATSSLWPGTRGAIAHQGKTLDCGACVMWAMREVAEHGELRGLGVHSATWRAHVALELTQQQLTAFEPEVNTRQGGQAPRGGFSGRRTRRQRRQGAGNEAVGRGGAAEGSHGRRAGGRWRRNAAARRRTRRRKLERLRLGDDAQVLSSMLRWAR